MNQVLIFDTLQQETVVWNLPEHIKWYSCGPTVYAPAHLGHARNYVVNDLIRRALEKYFNTRVHLCINITDVDDKILNVFPEEPTEAQLKEFTQKMESSFWDDMKQLGNLPPTTIVRVSESMDSIIDYIDKIIQNNCAYVEDGSVYFSGKTCGQCKSFPRTLQSAIAAERLRGPEARNEPSDFVLWKAHKGIWNSKWSKGRPGWHIECSAMSTGILGDYFDLHTGGEDLMFPHHQNEILQTFAHSGQQLCKHWLHVGHLHIQGQKMSKSLKNFITIQDALQQWSSRVIRLCFMKHDWTRAMDFSDTGMQECKNIDKIFDQYVNWIPNLDQESKFSDIQEHNAKISQCLVQNFNFSGVIQYLQQEIKRRTISPTHLKQITLNFGIEYTQRVTVQEVSKLFVNFRTQIRTVLKDKTLQETAKIAQIFKLCDSVRDQDCKNININIDDSK